MIKFIEKSIGNKLYSKYQLTLCETCSNYTEKFVDKIPNSFANFAYTGDTLSKAGLEERTAVR